MAYTSSTFKMGMSPAPIEEARNGSLNYDEFLNRLSKEYSKWVRQNRKVHRFNSYAITWALIFATVGLIFFMGGVVIGIQQARGSILSDGLLVGEILVSLVVGFCLYNSDSIFTAL
jgi:hypothetical protein